MASRFWVGGTGNWDASTTTHWSATSGGAGGASVPTTSDAVTFNGSSGGGTVTGTATMNMSTFTGDAFTGTFNTNGQTLNCTTFSITGTATRTFTLGASAINCTVWTATTTTGLTFNSNTSTITMSGSGTFNGGGLTYATVIITGITNTINGANTFTTLTRTGAANITSTFEFGANQTISGTLTINGNSTINRILVQSSTISTSRTLTAATVSVSYADFRDITGAGAGSWNLSAITGKSGDCGGNSGITFTTSATQTWSGTSGGNWSTNAWSGRLPLPQDDVVINASFSASQIITADMRILGKSISFSGATGTPELTTSTDTSICGSLTLISGMILTASTQTLRFIGRGNYTLTSAGFTWAKIIQFNALGGTLTLQDDLSTTASISVVAGELITNGNDVTGTFLSISSIGSINIANSILTSTGNGGFWNFSSTGSVTSSTNSTIKFTNTTNTAINFIGGGQAYNNVWFSRGASTGSITISGSNTFNDFKDDGTAAHSILFTTGTTQTFTTFTVSGTVGNLITINSTTTGTHALVKSGGGVISSDYLNIQHSVATPGSTWYAGTNSTNNQATATAGSGWIFTAPPSANTSAFFQLF